jgi:hypothetical protein
MVLGIGLLIFWVVIVPLILGMLMFHKKSILVISDIFKAYISGVTFVFALFEVITVPVTFLNGSLTLATVMWAVICLLLILCGVYRFLKKGHIKKIDLKKKKINCWF